MKTRYSGISEKILAAAADALRSWNSEGRTLDDCVDLLRKQDPETSGAASGILFEYFRHKTALDTLVLHASSQGKIKPGLLEIALCAFTQSQFQTGIVPESAVNVAVELVKHSEFRRAAGFMNALLREALRLTEGRKPAAGIAPKLETRWKKRMKAEDFKTVLEECRKNPELTFRLRCGELPEELKAAGCTPVAEDFTDGFSFYLCPEPEKLFAAHAFRNGDCYVQDPATAMSISLCRASLGGRVLDACAAPGGKTLMLHDLSGGKGAILASDRSPDRTARMKENLERLKTSRIECRCADALKQDFGKEAFDLVFLDAPCSNTGVIRRRPDVSWHFSRNRLEEIVSLQRRLLDALSVSVKKGGVLLYSTCSIEPEEDSLQTEEFLKRHTEFILEEERLLLPGAHHDGAFAARLRRK